MGKVVKTLLVVAAAVAIAYFAPYLATTFLSLSGIAATVATAAIGIVLSTAAGFAMGIIFPAPSARGGSAPWARF